MVNLVVSKVKKLICFVMALNRRIAKLEILVHAQVKSATCTFNVFCARKQFAHV